MIRKELKMPWLYERPWYKPGKWEVTPFTFSKKSIKRMPNLPKKVLPTDTTLREGLHMAGVYLETEGYLEVAERLADIGVNETDFGNAAEDKHCEAMKLVYDSGVNISKRIITQLRPNWKDLIDRAAKNGADVIKLQCNGGPLWRTKVTRPELYESKVSGKYIPLVLENIKYIKDEYDLYIQAGLTGATLTEIGWMKEWAKASVDAGADRVSLSDSRGVGSPVGMQYLCEEIRSVIGDADLEVHCHNDFGLAVANTIGSVQGGCTSFDCTINGLGDRAGNAALDECVLALELLYGVDTGVNIEKLYELSTWMEQKAGIKQARTKAITGPGAFLEQAESHIAAKFRMERLGLTADWILPYDPSIIGRQHTAVWGITSLHGTAIRSKIEGMGLSYTDSDVDTISKKGWEIINKKIGTGEAWITDEDFIQIIKGVLKK